MSEAVSVVALAYAAPELSAYSVPKANVVRWLACAPSCVGLLILFGFACSGLGVFVSLGLVWLMAGGFFAFTVGVLSLVLYLQTRAGGQRDADARRLYGWAVIHSLLALPTAGACVFGGLLFIDLWHSRF